MHFILEPLYKIYSHVLSEDTDALKSTLSSLGIHLKPVMYKMDVRPLLKVVLDQFFGSSTGLVDIIVENIPSPVGGAANKVCICPHLDQHYSDVNDLRLKAPTLVPKPQSWQSL